MLEAVQPNGLASADELHSVSVNGRYMLILKLNKTNCLYFFLLRRSVAFGSRYDR